MALSETWNWKIVWNNVYAISLLAIFCNNVSFAQQYHWRRALPASCRSVAFNPLSKGQTIFAGPAHQLNGIFRSDDGGMTWTLHNTDTLSVPLNNVHQIFCVPGDTSVILAVTPNGFYRSIDGGLDWNMIMVGGVDGEDIAWHEAGSTLYYGESFGYALWKSKDYGATWSQIGFANADSLGLCSLDVSSDVPPTIIQGSTDSGFLARTTDDGNHWQITLHSDSGTETEVPKVVFSKYALDPANGRHDVALAIRWLSEYRSLVASPDGGETWKILPSPSSYPWALDIDQRERMISKPTDEAYPLPLHFFIGLFGVESDTAVNGMVQETTDGGMSWHGTNFPKGSRGDTSNPLVNLVWVLKYDTTTGRIAAATDSGVYIADSAASEVSNAQELNPSVSITIGPTGLHIETASPVRSAVVFDLLGRACWQLEGNASMSSMTIPTYGGYFGFGILKVLFWNGEEVWKPISLF